MPRREDTVWDENLIARFKRLHQNGKMSFTAIAAQLSREFGIRLTKNACIGKGRRLDLEKRPRTDPPKPRKRPVNTPDLPAIPAIAEVVPVVLPRWEVVLPPPQTGKLTIYQLTSSVCHYPFGDRPPYSYCGEPARRGSWCLQHELVVYPRGGGR